jgi:virginiamycin A acetyltransferase
MREVIRSVFVRGAQLAVLPLIALCWIERVTFGAERCFGACAELLSLAPGLPGSLVRIGFYAATLRRCAFRAHISFGTVIVHRDAEIERDVYVGPYCIIGSAAIGAGAKIGSRVSITSGRHQHNTGNIQAIDSDPQFEPVSIGAQAWIGEGAIVMANVGRSSIVGAGSVVTGAVPDGWTVVGNPARRLERLAGNG